MALIKSISGIRGTIGGKKGDNLTPIDIVESAAGFGQWVKKTSGITKIVIGRDARISGELVSNLVTNTLMALGIDVIDLGLSTTPTVEIAVPLEKAGGGIILTASHNPRQWNALKLLNHKGEFISSGDGKEVLELIQKGEIEYAEVDQLGNYASKAEYIDKHIDQILALDTVDVEMVKFKKFTIVVDAINSTGSISVSPLLRKLGCEVVVLNGDLSGQFAHNPEPLPQNLADLSKAVLEHQADLGIAVDPDVDRLAFVCENGVIFGEEYTLVAVADYLLQKRPGSTVSNLSSSRALRDITLKYNQDYHAAAVGEVNVVSKMKEVNAVIGGEGNGGIIFPELHYGRDALVGIALFLTHLAASGKKVSELKATYPEYTIKKNKIDLSPDLNLNQIFAFLKEQYPEAKTNEIDGLKLDLENGWIHLRKSNTEPIIRVYTESKNAEAAQQLAEQVMSKIKEIQRK